jgi:hypothetical protein
VCVCVLLCWTALPLAAVVVGGLGRCWAAAASDNKATTANNLAARRPTARGIKAIEGTNGKQKQANERREVGTEELAVIACFWPMCCCPTQATAPVPRVSQTVAAVFSGAAAGCF